MKPVILVFGQQQTCELLQESLSDHYHIIQPAEPPPAKTNIDLCVLDTYGLDHLNGWLRDRKRSEAPVEFPVLLIAAPDELPTIHRTYRLSFDGLIVIPFEAAELFAQVRLLLRLRELTRRLKSRSERLASVSKAIESTSDAISIADTTGKTIYLNRAFTELYGFHVNELNVRGIPESLFVNPLVAEEILTQIQGKRSWKGEVALKTKQGHIVPTLLRVDSIEDQAGHRIGLISVHTDITERKRVEIQQREQRALENALRNIVITLISTLDLNEVLDRILENVGRVVSHDMAYIVLKVNETARVVRATGVDDYQAAQWLADQQLIVKEDAELDRMEQSGKPIVVPHVDNIWQKARPPGMHMIQSYVAAPIHLRGDLSGFLFLSSKTPAYFSQVHADRLQVFAGYAAIALQNAQLFEQAQELATMKERQRLARSLHDAVSQTLYSTSVIAEALPLLWKRDPAQGEYHLSQLRRLTRGALAEMRTLLLALRPNNLIEADFNDLLHHLTEALQGKTHIEVALDIEETHPLPEDVQTNLFFIAQEALNNVVKHAEASKVAVYYNSTRDQIELNVVDNGRGFDTAQVVPTSMGLGIMTERAEAVDASLQITSQIGQGTRIALALMRDAERKAE